MNSQNSTTEGHTIPETRKLTPSEQRIQDRKNERVTKEANIALNLLKEKFTDFFYTHDNPEGEEVKERIKQISAQWKGWCKRKEILPKFFGVMEDFCNDCLAEYKYDKEGKSEVETIQEISDSFKITDNADLKTVKSFGEEGNSFVKE